MGPSLGMTTRLSPLASDLHCSTSAHSNFDSVGQDAAHRPNCDPHRVFLRSDLLGYADLSSSTCASSLLIDHSVVGIYVVLFLASLVLMLRRMRSHGMNIPILASICALFVLCTTHFAIEFNHFYTVLVRPLYSRLRIDEGTQMTS